MTTHRFQRYPSTAEDHETIYALLRNKFPIIVPYLDKLLREGWEEKTKGRKK